MIPSNSTCPRTKPKDIKSNTLNLEPNNVKFTMSSTNKKENTRDTRKLENVAYKQKKGKAVNRNRLKNDTDI